jgi:NADH-quinone oxidoreductase subunit C
MTAGIWLERWEKAGAWTVSRHDAQKEGLEGSAFIPASILIQCARELGEADFTLLDVSALEASEGLAVTYHFDSLEAPLRLALRVLVNPRKPSLPSIEEVFQGAQWHERETADFFGLIFQGNSNPIPLILPDDFPGPPPLKKAPEALAALKKLGLFGQVKVLDEDFGRLAGLAEGVQ